MSQLPDDLMIAYQNFTLLATKLGFAFAGMMTGTKPPSLTAIGNVTEKGHELAALLREYADILDDRTDRGMVSRPELQHPN